MELQDEVVIAAPKDTVYRALNDPDVLAQCIPGCESLTQRSPNEFEGTIALKFGPVKIKLGCDIVLDPTGAPDAFSLSGQGSGGAAGHAKGGADVTLVERDGQTVLGYRAKAEIGGRLAQLGARLIQSTSRKLAGDFFKAFSAHVSETGTA
ncbi:MAG: carbon monoxide dehydrogenase subunit G [Pseudomonadota bacterium]